MTMTFTRKFTTRIEQENDTHITCLLVFSRDNPNEYFCIDMAIFTEKEPADKLAEALNSTLHQGTQMDCGERI